MPVVQTDTTGTPCADSDSVDLLYIKSLLNFLADDGSYNVSRVFIAGHSMGAGMGAPFPIRQPS